jgi:hypothetical protein
MGVPPKTPGLIAFEGLFELYNRSGRLLPDPLKTSFQNVLPKRPLKISFQSFFANRLFVYNRFAYNRFTSYYIFIYTARETYKGSNSFNIQVNYEISKNTRQASSK